ncbi:hypothetical protein KY320_01115 [Candidatus Woesearchaeota archaeon]|nr:hypothetical protein [Candidatus Woesearchaeota archaeon]
MQIQVLPSIEEQQRRSLDELVKTMDDRSYAAHDISIARRAFWFAAQYHKGEVRKTIRKPSDKGLERPFIVHPAGVAQEVAQKEEDIVTIVSGMLHDCPEALIERREVSYGLGEYIPAQAAAQVRENFQQTLWEAQLAFSWESMNSVENVITAMTRVPKKSAFSIVGPIFAIKDEVDLMRALLLKCTDRYMNTIETRGYSSSKKLYSVFKTFVFANLAKMYMLSRMYIPRRCMFRAQDLTEYVTLRHTLDGYGQRRAEQVAARHHLFGSLVLTIDDLGAASNEVIDRVTNAQQDRKDKLSESQRREAERAYWRAKCDGYMYEKSGGHIRVTPKERGQRIDGTILRYLGYVKDNNLLDVLQEDPVQMVLDALLFERLFLKLQNEPRYYLKGLGWKKLQRAMAG